MSRHYSLTIMARGLSPEQVNSVAEDSFYWDATGDNGGGDYTECNYDGTLPGVQTEQQAHDELYTALKSLNPAAKIRTRFTYLEDLPYEEYGMI